MHALRNGDARPHTMPHAAAARARAPARCGRRGPGAVRRARARASAGAASTSVVEGVVTRVARMGKRLTFVDVRAREQLRTRDGEETSTVFVKCAAQVPPVIRPGAVVEFEYEWETRRAKSGTRSGAYVSTTEMRVVELAPVTSVANATSEMLEKFAGVGLIDTTARRSKGFGICKVLLGGGVCSDPNCDKRHDVNEEELSQARESRKRARERSKMAIERERSDNDPHGDANKEAKCVSDRLFAEWCVETFKLKERREVVVADIAGGAGALSFEFHVNHGVGVVLIEPRCVALTPRQRATAKNLRRRGARNDANPDVADAWLRSEIWVKCADEQNEKRMHEHVQRLVAYTEIASSKDINVSASAPPTDVVTLHEAPFDEFPTELPRTVVKSPFGAEIAPFTHIRSEFWTTDSSVGARLREMRPSLLVGMHSDQATEAIIDAALELDVPFAVVPCCTFPELFPHRRTALGGPVASYADFIEYLRGKHPSIRSTFLPFKGRNQVLYKT